MSDIGHTSKAFEMAKYHLCICFSLLVRNMVLGNGIMNEEDCYGKSVHTTHAVHWELKGELFHQSWGIIGETKGRSAPLATELSFSMKNNTHS